MRDSGVNKPFPLKIRNSRRENDARPRERLGVTQQPNLSRKDRPMKQLLLSTALSIALCLSLVAVPNNAWAGDGVNDAQDANDNDASVGHGHGGNDNRGGAL